MIRSIEFVGNNLFSSEELNQIFLDQLPQEMTFDQLAQMADQVSNFYRLQGYWVAAILPEQIFTDEILIIEVLESSLGEAIIQTEEESLNIPINKLEKYLTHRLNSNSILNTFQLEKNIANINAIPGLLSMANLQPGQKELSTDILLSVYNTPTYNFNTTFDNYGSRASGEERLINALSFKGLLNKGESIDISQAHTQGSDYTAVSTNFPVGYGGGRTTWRYSHMAYELGTPFNSTKPSGTSEEVYIDLSSKLFQIQKFNFSGRVAASHTNYDNDLLTGKSNKKYIEKIVANFSFDSQDSLLLGGISYGDVALTQGILNLKGYSTDYDNDQLSAKTHGPYSKVALSFGKIQQINSSDQLSLKFSSQYAFKNLDGAEQLSLGGSSGVRAYPSGEGSGSHGFLTNFEYKKQLFDNFSISAFYDYGMVQVYKNTYSGWNSTNSSHKNQYFLKGAGVGASLVLNEYASISYQYAKKIGNNNGKDTDGNNSDGLNLSERHLFSLQINYQF
jgi:hemolysin activation/secretion protein